MNSLIKFNIHKIILCIILCLFLVGCSEMDKIKSESINVKNTKMLEYFKKNIPDSDVVYVREGDLNGDSLDDMVIVFKHIHGGKIESAFTVVLNYESEYKILDHYKAPMENQRIDLKEVDNKPPMEFVVSGSKNGRAGLSVYRIEDNKIRDIFGSEGMDEC